MKGYANLKGAVPADPGKLTNCGCCLHHPNGHADTNPYADPYLHSHPNRHAHSHANGDSHGYAHAHA